MKNRQTKILVCCHRRGGALPHAKVYMPILCGKALSGPDSDMQGDNTGENISSKNPNYCELTAMYWAWKNMRDARILGLCHYRRYFNFSILSGMSRSRHKTVLHVKDWSKGNICSTRLERLLKRYDIILAKPERLNGSVGEHYATYHNRKDLMATREAIERLFPAYTESFDHVIEKNDMLSPYNMFITRREIFDSYCDWLFSILAYVEQNIPIPDDPYQKRVFGFIAERLLNVYCHHNRLKINYRQVCMIQ